MYKQTRMMMKTWLFGSLVMLFGTFMYFVSKGLFHMFDSTFKDADFIDWGLDETDVP